MEDSIPSDYLHQNSCEMATKDNCNDNKDKCVQEDFEDDDATGRGLMKQLENYIIVDIGANLTSKKFARDLDSVIQRAKEAGKQITRINGG